VDVTRHRTLFYLPLTGLSGAGDSADTAACFRKNWSAKVKSAVLATRRVGHFMAPKSKKPGAEASTAPAPALSLQKVALWVLTALLCLSLATKAQGLSPLYGPGKLYAGGLLQLSEVFEVGTLALLYADRPLGVLALFMYVGDTPSAGSWPRTL